MEPMTEQQKRAAISLAWATYRADSQRIDRDAPWSEFLEADERLWRRYLAAEKAILSALTAKAA